MDQYFDDFSQRIGIDPVIYSLPVSQPIMDTYADVLPKRLLSYWQEQGFCGFANGLFWTVNPGDFEDQLQGWLEKTPLKDRENYYVIARTAFGKLYAWGDVSKKVTVLEPHYNTILPVDMPAEPLSDEQVERRIGLFFQTKSPKTVDFYDAGEKLMFLATVKKLGALEHDEMYTFAPALALGGSAVLENVKKVKIHEQLALLIELDNPQVLQTVSQLAG